MGNSAEEIIAKGKLFELVQTTQPDGRVFELARRAPGVRIIIVDRENKKILLTREFRTELNDWDHRLPGGKVFDSLEEYEQHRQSGDDILDAATRKAKAEAVEETGIELENIEFFKKSTLGATVEWDLYVFVADKWHMAKNGQQLENGEQIEADNWVAYEDIEKMILAGEMQEDRIALILLQWINKETA